LVRQHGPEKVVDAGHAVIPANALNSNLRTVPSDALLEDVIEKGVWTQCKGETFFQER